jgi:hypothetical protein
MPTEAIRVREEAARLGARGERQQIGELLGRARASAENYIDAALAQTARARAVWDREWRDALGAGGIGRPDAARAETGAALKGMLGLVESYLNDASLMAHEYGGGFRPPLARLDELASALAEFPVWAAERLARWEMLDEPVPPLDPEALARHRAALERGEFESIDEVLARLPSAPPEG